MNRYGGSQKTGMEFAVKSMTDITAEENTQTDGGPQRSSDRENISYSGHGKVMPCSRGENSLMPAGNGESTVPCFAMNPITDHRTLSDRLTPLLIARGLVKGIIPLSMRGRLGQLTLDAVLRPQDGRNAEERKAV